MNREEKNTIRDVVGMLNTIIDATKVSTKNIPETSEAPAVSEEEIQFVRELKEEIDPKAGIKFITCCNDGSLMTGLLSITTTHAMIDAFLEKYDKQRL